MDYLEELPIDGFESSPALAERLEHLKGLGIESRFTKTGTTIVGCIYRGGVAIAADTRATGGSTVLDKNCEKLHYLAPNIYCAGAGTAADTEHTTLNVSYELELLRLYTRRDSRVKTAMAKLFDRLVKYGGHIGAYLIVGGIDVTGPCLYNISADGNYRQFPYATLGSGSLAAMSVFETYYNDDMEREEASDLCIKAIESGIFNDLGSGSNVDVVLIDERGVEMRRNVRKYNQKASAGNVDYTFKSGVSPIRNTYNLVVQDVAME